MRTQDLFNNVNFTNPNLSPIVPLAFGESPNYAIRDSGRVLG